MLPQRKLPILRDNVNESDIECNNLGDALVPCDNGFVENLNEGGNYSGLNVVQERDYSDIGVNIEGGNCSGLSVVQDEDYGYVGVSIEGGNCSGLNAVPEGDYDAEMDDQLNESNADDFEVVEDVELRPCDSEDEEKMCDSEDEQAPIDIHKNTTVKEFKYQPDGSIKLVVGHAFPTLDFLKKVLVDFCV
ncbi:hypothetical protein OWV82_008673 [Melia azedarach]|uniref:Uncharacterized protein n=1 Tax=Melia azedarach TaxID=155640 RepID=A0ACC1YD63_MELAZ|nr:hypothetical protein OWV82_008673 [Melia azedarach]